MLKLFFLVNEVKPNMLNDKGLAVEIKKTFVQIICFFNYKDFLLLEPFSNPTFFLIPINVPREYKVIIHIHKTC